MNIAQAKKELIHTVWAYTAKNEQGQYRIPRMRDRTGGIYHDPSHQTECYWSADGADPML